MKDADLIAKFQTKVLHQQRIMINWEELNRLLDLANIALRYRRLAADRQKRMDRAKKHVFTMQPKGDLS
jgi:hypothetical protein